LKDLFDKKVIELARVAEDNIKPLFEKIEEIEEHNQLKVLMAFKNNNVNDAHFVSTNGYGYNDLGRECIESIFAEVFNAEDALVRYNINNGTHAISLCLWAALRPGDTMISITGTPYDTLAETIGITGFGNGSLKDFGVNYTELNYEKEDYINIIKSLKPKVVFIQKSKGYNYKNSLSTVDINNLQSAISRIVPDTIFVVDNCYGEFVELDEPSGDLLAGSLIKNLGGGIAQAGGYVVGRKNLVEQAAYKLNAVGLGKECGASLGANRELLMGIFMAPHVVAQAHKTALFTSELFKLAGFDTNPETTLHTDLIQAIKLKSKQQLIDFCQGVQSFSPVNSAFLPVADDMPGYSDQVIMAAGTFVQGSSIELSADSAIKEPYIAYCQGGLTYGSAKLGIMAALNRMKVLQ
jgi:cystathionine beta-lyase family protein involved in aluminum resistance